MSIYAHISSDHIADDDVWSLGHRQRPGINVDYTTRNSFDIYFYWICITIFYSFTPHFYKAWPQRDYYLLITTLPIRWFPRML